MRCLAVRVAAGWTVQENGRGEGKGEGEGEGEGERVERE